MNVLQIIGLVTVLWVLFAVGVAMFLGAVASLNEVPTYEPGEWTEADQLEYEELVAEVAERQ